MREIEFRVYRYPLSKAISDKGFMIYNYNELDIGDFWLMNDIFIKSKDEVFMQYTGLTDRSGTKIFEGDIVKVEFNTFDDNGYTLSTRTVIGEVYFDTNEYAYKVLEHLGIFNDGSFEDYNSFPLYDCIGCEVIGNIYDNPELLEGDDVKD